MVMHVNFADPRTPGTDKAENIGLQGVHKVRGFFSTDNRISIAEGYNTQPINQIN